MKDRKEGTITLRFAREGEEGIILKLIQELAQYEHMEELVTASEEELRNTIFQKKIAEVVLAHYQEETAGYALFFHNMSTFTGKPGIYLEDLYVTPKFRKKGIGKALISFVASIAIERHCGRLEWSCLNWNTPSRQFYESLGAKPLEEWIIHRMDGKELEHLAEKNRAEGGKI